MGFSTSVNIERDFGKTPDYIVTANARQAVGKSSINTTQESTRFV